MRGSCRTTFGPFGLSTSSAEARGRRLQLVGIVHEREGTPVERDEGVVRPGHRQRQAGGVLPVRREEAERLRLGRQAGVEAEHHVRLRGGALEPQPPEETAGVLGGHEGDVAPAGRLEALLDDLAGPVFPDEGRVGVDRQDGLGLGGLAGRGRDQPDRDADGSEDSHRSPPGGANEPGGGERQAGDRTDSVHPQSLRRHDPVQVRRVGLRLSAPRSTP